jgi:hypothetical protein
VQWFDPHKGERVIPIPGPFGGRGNKPKPNTISCEDVSGKILNPGNNAKNTNTQ